MAARLLLVAPLLLAACAATSGGGGSPAPIDLPGEYRGTYTLIHEAGSGEQWRQSGEMSMTFAEDGTYEIMGDRLHLPPAGSGTWERDGDDLVLDDTAMHTADFDWTLILDGRFALYGEGDGRIRLRQRDLDHDRIHELALRPVGRAGR
jgi:hypothetical protein